MVRGCVRVCDIQDISTAMLSYARECSLHFGMTSDSDSCWSGVLLVFFFLLFFVLFFLIDASAMCTPAQVLLLCETPHPTKLSTHRGQAPVAKLTLLPMISIIY